MRIIFLFVCPYEKESEDSNKIGNRSDDEEASSFWTETRECRNVLLAGPFNVTSPSPVGRRTCL